MAPFSSRSVKKTERTNLSAFLGNGTLFQLQTFNGLYFPFFFSGSCSETEVSKQL
jgi:hypothetical protein